MQDSRVKLLTKIAILGTISFILMAFDFPIPMIPVFYKIDFSEVFILIGGFALGPMPAAVIEALKVILKLLIKGTDTAYIGDIANFIIGCALVIPASWIYHRNKTRKGAITGMITGVLIMTVIGVIVNYFVLLPAYSYFYHLPMDKLIGMGTALIPLIKDKLTFVLLATTPFNLIKGFLVSLLTTLVYKRVSPLLHR
ncbi:MAG: ECF transporter S component [Solobacterium sp.]|nr:ECF transporter S component [Solobacterium sp.]